MKTKHTPGPWGLGLIDPQYNDIGAYQVAIVQSDETDKIIPGFAFGETKEICIANAKLIAAAPELLEALRLAKDDLTFLYAQNQNDKFWSEHAEINFSKINATITKATE